ncbi:MAG TPA: hypothetical protein VF681_01465 [Abditibacteriaceae bacterium]|jgi:hypothetical protein
MKFPPGISPLYVRRAILLGALIFDDLLICGLLLWQLRNFGLSLEYGIRYFITPTMNWMPLKEIFDKYILLIQCFAAHCVVCGICLAIITWRELQRQRA